MPKRSNGFQKLIALVNKQLAGLAHTEESALLTDAVTGESREVDVLIKASIADYETRLAIECIDWKRKADVTWVEKMFQKHQNLPTDKLILVSRSGFSSAATRKAQFLNITTLTLEAAIEQDWLWNVQAVVISDIQLRVMKYELQLSDILEDAIIEDPLFFNPEGNPGDLIGLIRSEILSRVDLNKALIDLLAEKKDAKRMVLTVDLATGIYRQWYILDSRKQKRNIKWFHMHIQIQRSEETKQVQYRRYGNANIAFAPLDEQQKDIVAFVQSRDGTVTAAADSVVMKDGEKQKGLAEYLFLNDQLFQSTVKNIK